MVGSFFKLSVQPLQPLKLQYREDNFDQPLLGMYINWSAIELSFKYLNFPGSKNKNILSLIHITQEQRLSLKVNVFRKEKNCRQYL